MQSPYSATTAMPFTSTTRLANASLQSSPLQAPHFGSRHLIPLFVHASVISCSRSSTPVRRSLLGIRMPPYDIFDGCEDGRGLLARVWCCAIVDTGNGAIGQDGCNVRDVDCTTAGWNRSGRLPHSDAWCAWRLVFWLFETRDENEFIR
jgi:hypothetical protein